MKLRLLSLTTAMLLAATGALGQEKTATKKKAAESVEEKKSTAKKAADDAKKPAPAAMEKKAETAKTAAKTATAAKAYTGAVVNLNTATKTQLESLPGIGEANAESIVKGRPYKSVEDLLTRKIVAERYYNQFKQHVAVK